MDEQIKDKSPSTDYPCPYCKAEVDLLNFYPVMDQHDRWWHFTCAQKILSNYK